MNDSRAPSLHDRSADRPRFPSPTRPWWGERPGRLAVRGLVRMVIFGFLGWKLVELMGDSEPIRDLDIDLSDAAIDNVLAGAGLICIVLLSHGLVQFLFGSIDLFARRSTEGVLVAARARRPFDWLPAPVGWVVRLLRRRHHAEGGTVHDLDRRVRREIVVETDGAPRTWRVGPRRFEPSMQGQQVRVSYTPMLGHVRDIQALGPAPAPIASPSTHEAAPATPAATSAPAPSASAPPVGTVSPAGTTRSELPDQSEDVLSNIPGYEHYGRSRSHFPTTDMLKMIPGVGGIIDQIPGIGDPTKNGPARPPRPEDPASPPDEARTPPASAGSDPDGSDEPDHPG